MIKLINMSIFIVIAMAISMPVEAQRARTLEATIKATTPARALSLCKDKGGNLIEFRKVNLYYCYADIKLAQLELSRKSTSNQRNK